MTTRAGRMETGQREKAGSVRDRLVPRLEGVTLTAVAEAQRLEESRS